ncbi:MAG: T9SS type A sorting domain-containing protein [Fibromonadales bacterium]|nr:T9SS type A sorting domain-containing protein [Fibromonadales bacterium]
MMIKYFVLFIVPIAAFSQTAYLTRLPNEIIDFIVPASQYTNHGTGTTPEKQLSGTMISLGNFGGYITVKYNDPIPNDPKNPYGVDFTIYGNGNGTQGMSEPGNVYVSKDGDKWYLLAGSDYFDNNTVRDYEVTYTRSDATINGFQQSIYEDNLGSVFPISPNTYNNGYAYPLKEYYPLYKWEDGEEDKMTFKGPLLLSKAFDPYGSASAGFPAWGYADVHSNGDIGDEFGNPYTLNYADGAGVDGAGSYGNGFDISWAIDQESGKPVVLDEISYIKIQGASHIYGGRIGEKSPEITAILRAAEGTADVGVTTAPSAIKINGVALDLNNTNLYYTNENGGEISVEVESEATVFINNTRCTERTYETVPSSGVIRVVAQEETKQPQIYYIYISSSSSDDPSSSSVANTPVKSPQHAVGNIRANAINKTIILENLPQGANVQIYNLKGKPIYSANSENSKILRIPVQAKGLYIVKVGNQKWLATSH